MAKQTAMSKSIGRIIVDFETNVVGRKVDVTMLVNDKAGGYDMNNGWIGWVWGYKKPTGWQFFQTHAKHEEDENMPETPV